jgi:phosphoribosylformimino-5-aminoimidazole carboxamide ribotide isomerase
MPLMDLFPAIDLLGGRCVRLVEGDFARETTYGDDPIAIALRFAEAGARWIHVVDLDAARTGDPINRDVVLGVAAAVAPHAVKVQSGGGVRRIEDAAQLLDGGVERVVIGTAAVEHPQLVSAVASRWPTRVAVGLDHRGGEVRLRGWEAGAGRSVEELVPEVVAAGAAAVIVTDISRDGRLCGPDLEGLAALVEETGASIIASGGVSSTADLAALSTIRGLAGVIVGKAIYEGHVDVTTAMQMLS